LPHLALNPDVRKRFQQEAESASRLAHPNIVSIYDFGLAARGLPFIAMDFLQGKSLEDIIATESPLAAERCIDIFLQTCNGLEHAHAARVVHRDLKPSNLLVLEDGTVKLLDFGLAKPLPQEGSSQEKLTQTGQVFGSPEYMSPEQCRGIATDQRSDIYSFGCLMYETLSGAPPFQSENPIETIKKQVSESAAPLKCSQLAASMREGFEAIILKAMAKDRNARYQTMSEVKADLLKLSESPKSDFSSRLKTLWNINTLRLSGAAEDQTLMLKTAVVVLGIFVVLSCIAGIGFCVYWSMAHPESKI